MKLPALTPTLVCALVATIALAAPLFAAPDLALVPGEARAAFSTPWSVGPHDPAVLARDLTLVSANARAASGPVWVYFTDKGIRSGAEHTRALDRAESMLTPDARERRQVIAQGGPLVDYLDVQVQPEYV